MKTLLKILLVILLIAPQLLKAQKQNPWSNLNERYSDKWQEISSTKKQLNKEVLNSILEKVKTNGKTSLAIPTPEGLNSYFEIMESSVLAPKLKAKFPNIKTYKGINEKGEKIRLSMSINGFHATVFSDEGSYEINPESTNSYVYVSYRLANYEQFNNAKSKLSCYEDDFTDASVTDMVSISKRSADFTPRRKGDFHTKYRIAIIPNLVYVNYFGGTKEGALSGIVSTLNTVNEIFESNTSITFELIDNIESFIYTSKNEYLSDEHYNIVNTYRDLTELPDLFNELIGTENYDIGHLFMKEYPGGIATSPSICRDDFKARGISGIGTFLNPEGYYFDVNIVSHEIGHQLSGHHTMSSDCGGARQGSAAYEIGSGVTILGYFSNCQQYNVAETPTLDYFNARSIEQIVNRSENANCRELVSTGNTPPTVSVYESGFTIPVNTPFMLEANGSDEDGDSLTYCWEQYDQSVKAEDVRYAVIGLNDETFETVEEYNAYYQQYLVESEEYYIEQGFTEDQYGPSLEALERLFESNATQFWEGDGPLFRSFSPTTNNKRYFPELSKVIDGTADKLSFEVMPHKTRDLNFAVTVRDNSILGGGIATDIVSFSSTANAGPFKVTTTFIDSNYVASTDIELEWDVANTNVSPVNCQTVDVLYSTNGGETFDITLLEGIPNNGRTTINLPNISTSEARIMIKAADNIFFNVNDTNFIVSSVLSLDENEFSHLKIYPNPVKNTLYIDTEEEILLKLIDLNGKTVLTKNIKENTNLDVTRFSSGIYILNLKSKYNTTYKKIIKN